MSPCTWATAWWCRRRARARRIKVSPIAANPVLGAVRPDPDGEPLGRYTPPELPEGPTDGSDTGYAPPVTRPETSAR